MEDCALGSRLWVLGRASFDLPHLVSVKLMLNV